MTKYNRGFTLIELLVVIAIVGILSAVVLSQLNSAREKGADAAVKSNLVSVRSVAETLYDNGYNGYQGICSDSKMTGPHNAAVAAGGNGGTCTSNSGAYADWAGLKTDLTKAWCVDSTGNSRMIPKPGSGITVCP